MNHHLMHKMEGEWEIGQVASERYKRVDYPYIRSEDHFGRIKRQNQYFVHTGHALGVGNDLKNST